MSSTKRPTLILVLGDQLSRDMTSLAAADPADSIVLMAELADEATYVKHHKKKIAFLFSAMRHHALALREDGWTVDYLTLDGRLLDDRGQPDDKAGFDGAGFTDAVAWAIDRHDPARIVVTEPGEWRLAEMFDGWAEHFDRPVDIPEDHRFLCSTAEFAAWANKRKSLRMEYFYREMRRKSGLLMDGDNPIGGQWNFDKDNRKPATRDLTMAGPARFAPDDITRSVLTHVADRFADHIGTLEPFWFAVTAAQAEEALDRFIADSLSRFGDYQDAMLADERFLYHSILSPYINAGLLDPLAVCRRAEAAYAAGDAPLNAVEGFIRQIIGWREYVRGIYWREGPDYKRRNALAADRALPDFYWSGETDMACLEACITQTIDDAYAHHIQRLMITGTFALLAGVDPHAVHVWYLEVYADAYEWVEVPNTVGMSQFADGGLLASKPYAASANYINRMSDYCAACAYDPKKRTGEGACPFNFLYWDFIARHEERLRDNGRMAHMYQTWARFDKEEKLSIRATARAFLEKL